MAQRTVLVTGGGSGIGREIALAFAREGLDVAICGRQEDRLRAVRAELEATGVQALAVCADVSQEAAVVSLRDRVLERFGKVDIVVNNAAQFAWGNVGELPVTDFDRVLATNLRGPFLVSQSFLPAMIERAAGTIVMVGSTSGKRGDAGSSAYSASKFGLVGLSQSLFQEVRRHNIRVIMVYPSSVDTRIAPPGQKPESGPGSRLCAEDVAASILAATELPPRALVRELELWATNP